MKYRTRDTEKFQFSKISEFQKKKRFRERKNEYMNTKPLKDRTRDTLRS